MNMNVITSFFILLLAGVVSTATASRGLRTRKLELTSLTLEERMECDSGITCSNGLVCGGGGRCRRPVGEGCLEEWDCSTLNCDTDQNICLAATSLTLEERMVCDSSTTCSEGLVCGIGGRCRRPVGDFCLVEWDCSTLNCDTDQNVCLADVLVVELTLEEKVQCEDDSACSNGLVCGNGGRCRRPAGEACLVPGDCYSLDCENGACQEVESLEHRIGDVCVAVAAGSEDTVCGRGLRCGGLNEEQPSLQCNRVRCIGTCGRVPGDVCNSNSDCDEFNCNTLTHTCGN